MLVTKRNGETEKVDLDKIHKVLEWAAEGLDVSVSQVEMNAQIQLFEGIKTSDIHDTLIKAAADLISVETPDYQYLAARLAVFQVRKQVYGDFKVPGLLEIITDLTEKGIYDKGILETYNEQEISHFNNLLVHDRDLDFAYAGMNQLISKYLLQDRVSGKLYESPQIAYMVISMVLFGGYPVVQRSKYVAKMYEALSLQKVSLPTPIMAGVRTPSRQFSSCVLIEAGDSLDSIAEASSAIIKYVSQRAGIGLNVGAIRGLGSEIRGGEAVHTGLIPFLKLFQASVKSCSQGGVRGGAATVFYPLWHQEVESLLVLKNNRGVDENRVRQMDYGVQLNKLMYQRLIQGGNITLFSPHAVPGMYDAFFADQDKFEQLYLAAEADDTIPKTTVKAVDLFSQMMQERSQTGRIYIQNVDHCNTHGPFEPAVAPVKQSNLCVAPETQILTDAGYIEISSLEGERVNVWNGEEFSEVEVRQTGTQQPLMKVTTDSGQTLECTPDHKWYIMKSYGGKPVEVRTKDLKVGDKLIKFDLPIIDGKETLKDAYVNGFYTSDGCLTPQGQRVYLYATKRPLKHLFKEDGWTIQDEYDREYTHYKDLKDKFFVPLSGYTVESRLDWFAGALDGDGCVYRNGTNQQLVLTSNNYLYLQEVQMMLQTLGVSAKIRGQLPEGLRSLPKNDGTGDYKLYHCMETWRLLVTSNDVYKLHEMGLKLHRLEIVSHLPQRCAKHFVKVESVKDEGRVDDTFCFTEPKRHMGMFNGILTGQCVEIALPTAPTMPNGEGEIALCTLAAFNLGKIKKLSELEPLADLLVRALDNLLDYQDYPMPQAWRSTEKYRPLGIGVINYANYLAKRGFNYSSDAGNNETHKLFEAIQFYCLQASNKLARETHPCLGFENTKAAQGILCVDTYKKDVDSVHTEELTLDWDGLRRNIVEYGLRNATVTALMPSETSSQLANATNGIEPPRSLVTSKQSKDGVVKQVVPGLSDGLKYETVWEMPSTQGYLEKMAIMQKFICQSISSNTYYDPANFPNGVVPIRQTLKDLLTAYKLGIKTLYYHNTRDDTIIDTGEEDCEGGACKI